jgi:hypothetical protein
VSDGILIACSTVLMCVSYMWGNGCCYRNSKLVANIANVARQKNIVI